MASALCDCGTFAVGVCRDCGVLRCGDCSTRVEGHRICKTHLVERERERQAAEEAQRPAKEAQRLADDEAHARGVAAAKQLRREQFRQIRLLSRQLGDLGSPGAERIRAEAGTLGTSFSSFAMTWLKCWRVAGFSTTSAAGNGDRGDQSAHTTHVDVYVTDSGHLVHKNSRGRLVELKREIHPEGAVAELQRLLTEAKTRQ